MKKKSYLKHTLSKVVRSSIPQFQSFIYTFQSKSGEGVSDHIASYKFGFFPFLTITDKMKNKCMQLKPIIVKYKENKITSGSTTGHSSSCYGLIRESNINLLICHSIQPTFITQLKKKLTVRFLFNQTEP